MEEYANLSGKSGVVAYESGGTYITIIFSSGNTRTYTYDEDGSSDVEQMKYLAQAGQGLNRFLNNR